MPYRKINPRHSEPLIGMSKASELTGFKAATIQSWCRNGLFRCYVTSGGHYRFQLSDLKTYIDNNYKYETDNVESSNILKGTPCKQK